MILAILSLKSVGPFTNMLVRSFVTAQHLYTIGNQSEALEILILWPAHLICWQWVVKLRITTWMAR